MSDDRERRNTDPIPTIGDAPPRAAIVDADFPDRLTQLERTVAFWRRITWGAATFALTSIVAVIAFAYDRGGDDREGRFRLDYIERALDKGEARSQEIERRLLEIERSGRRRHYDAPTAPSQPVPSTYLPGDTL